MSAATAMPRAERLSVVDTAWLHMEMPTNLMMVGSLAFFDAPLEYEQLTSAMQRRLLGHPRFREHIEPSLVGPPHWVADGDFDIRAHIHRIALPAPGDDAALREMLGTLMSSPLDMSRPLWDTHSIEGYRGGGVLFTRIHHCIADGTALVRVLLGLTATTPEASLRAPRHRPPRAHDEGGFHLPPLLDPRHAAAGIVELGAQAYTLARLTALWPDAASPLRGKLSRNKRVAWTEPFPLELLRPLRRETGCTVNDILVTAVTGALRTYIRHHAQEVPPHIRALVPVDMRTDNGEGKLGNQFGLVFLDMPVGIRNRRARLDEVHARMDEARHSPQPMVAMEVLGALGMTPQRVQRQVVRFFGAKGTAVVTNVRGPADELYLAGAKLRHLTFFVPQSAGLAIGLSIMTYAGHVQMGVIADSHLVADPTQIARSLTQELRLLLS